MWLDLVVCKAGHQVLVALWPQIRWRQMQVHPSSSNGVVTILLVFAGQFTGAVLARTLQFEPMRSQARLQEREGR